MKRLALAVAVASTLVAAPAFADSTSSASLGPFTMTLYDLNPFDNITPSITFTTAGLNNDTHAYAIAYQSDPLTYLLDPSYGLVPWAPVSAAATSSLAWGNASLTGSLPFNSITGPVLAAAGGATTPVSATALYNAGYNAGTLALVDLTFYNFTLSANTLVSFSALATISGSAQAGSTTQTDYAHASAMIHISGPGASGSGYQYAENGIDNYVFSYPGDGFQSFSGNSTLGVSFVNLTGGNLSGTLAASVNADGYAYAAAVPEPETYALLLAGLGLIGVMARRKRS